MRHLIRAVIIVISLSILLYLILRWLELPDQIIAAFSAAPLASVALIHQLLRERSGPPRFSTEPREIVPLDEYSLPWHQLYIYGTLIFIAIEVILSILGIVFLLFTSIQLGFESPYEPLSSIPSNFILINLFMLIVFFILGKWVGVRSSLSPILGVLVVVAIITTVRFIYLLVSLFVFPELFEFGVASDPLVYLLAIGLIFIVFGVVGYWRGRTTRISSYLNFLVKKLPKDTQVDLIDIVFDELQKDNNSS